jgi:hypothetical protein
MYVSPTQMLLFVLLETLKSLLGMRVMEILLDMALKRLKCVSED